jgi:Tfp pilus assembly protein PilV
MIWKLLGGGVVLALAAFMIMQIKSSSEAKGAAKASLIWQKKVSELSVRLAKKSASQQVAWADQRADAIEASAANQARIDPIILRATDKVTIYAKTADGAVQCLPAERVRDIAADRDRLFAVDTTPATKSPVNLLPDALATQP